MWSQQGEDKLSLDRPISFSTRLEHPASWTKMLLPFQLCQPVKPRLFLSSNGLIHQPKSLLSTWVTRVTPCDRGRGFTYLNVYGPYGLVRPCTVRPLWTSPITPMLNTPSSALTPLCFTSLYSTLQHSQVQKEEGSIGLFGTKETLSFASQAERSSQPNKAPYKKGDRRGLKCEHCKRDGHTKERCWILNPSLKPAKFKWAVSMEVQEISSDLLVVSKPPNP